MSVHTTQNPIVPPATETLRPPNSATTPLNLGHADSIAANDYRAGELLLGEALAGTIPPETSPGDAEAYLGAAFPKAPAPGGRVGRYLVEEVLGRGGMGLVLRAHDELLQRDVAIKVILPHYLSSDPTAGLRFLREAEIVAKLKHPHIISVYDAGLDAGVAYLAFDFVRGESFAEVRSKHSFSVSEAVDLLLPIVSAVAYANELGIVHGDIKPTNLILTRDYRGGNHPCILDFGVSFFSELDAGLDPTRGKITGTPGYIAPEWWTQAGIDGRADCFSLGCVLYELIVGKGPYAACRRLSEAQKFALEKNYVAPSILLGCSTLVDDIIARVLAPAVEDRYASTHAFGSALLPLASPGIQARYVEEFG